jgi:predicted transcriptional regulator
MAKTKIAYYPLHHDEYLSTRNKLKPNELDIYLYLITKHPFADSKLEIDTSLISEQLGYHRRTVQLAIQKLISLNLLEVEITKFKYKQARHGHESKIIAESANRQNLNFRPLESESVDRQSESVDRDLLPKPLLDKDFETLQTIQTIQTLQTFGEVDFISESTAKAEPCIESSTKLSPSKKISPDRPELLTETLRSRLQELEIPIDKKIREAINKYGESQAWKAIGHIEATKGGIRSKYGVFLYQIAKQVEEIPQKALSSEFLEWYNRHRGEIVEDIPPELLPLDRYQEPMVRLKSRAGELIEWRRAADGTDTERSPFDLRTILEKFPLLKDRLRGKKYERE